MKCLTCNNSNFYHDRNELFSVVLGISSYNNYITDQSFWVDILLATLQEILWNSILKEFCSIH